MSESDIDIEEHDILDDPAIKKIFPDISLVKQEISQYYNEVFKTPSDTPLEELCEEDAIAASGSQLPDQIHKIEHVTSSCLLNSEDLATKDARYLHGNVLIVGSKPNLQFNTKIYNESSLLKEPKLIIKDINIFLNNCKRYCKACLILFPKAHLLNLHMINIHTKNQKQITFMGSKVADKLFKCNVCDKYLSSRCNLLRHFRNLHGDVKALKTVGRSDYKIQPSKVSQTKVSKGLSCFHCHQLFSSQSSLIEHLYQVLEIDKMRPSDRLKSLANAGKPNDQNVKDQLNVEQFVSYQNELLVNDRAGKSTQMDTDNADIDEDDLPQAKTSVHRVKSNNKNKSTSKVNNFKCSSKKSCHSLFYKCFICSKYNMSVEYYSRHIINDHKLQEVPEVRKVPFDPQCKFCSSRTSGVKSYNVHLFKYHKKQLKRYYFPNKDLPINKKGEKEDKKNHLAFKSILYKCMKCDLFFLSANAAVDHSKHLGISDTWECPVCQRIFRRESMALHIKQHSFSQYFTVHTLAEAAFTQLLYKCSICTVHYSEENFLLHYPKCDSETPNSLYCKVCDILINKDDMESHVVNHKEKKKQSCDFIIIESDMIDDSYTSKNTAETDGSRTSNHTPIPKDIHTAKTNDSRTTENTPKTDNNQTSEHAAGTKSHTLDTIENKHMSASKTKTYLKTRLDKKTNNETLKYSKLAMSFCHTCKCFIYNINLRMLHIQGKCGHMLRYACKDCGLMLTSKTHETHKNYHKKKQTSLHDFIFYDLKTEKRILPPIPDYPKCNSCGVHFLRNCDVRLHSCQEQDYITCNVCSTKLIEQAYKLHIQFHSYSIPNTNTKLKKTALPVNRADDKSCAESNSSVSNDSYITNVMFSYSCKSCRLTVSTYDKVVQHCQDHYESKIVLSNMQKCQYCNLTLLLSDYESHNKLHLNETFNMDSIKVVDFDPFYFRFNNEFWANHIFAYVAGEDITQILRNSIYRYECRLKMEKIQSGWSDSVLYRCDKCQVFVDPQHMYTHAINTAGKSCAKMRKHPCSLCGLNFTPLAYRAAHELEHEGKNVNLKSYKIIIYNKKEHEPYNKIICDANNRYVLYQCRNCERAVDNFERNVHVCDEKNLKLCSICGLLLDKLDFDLHCVRHEELDKFNVPNIIIVMFGKTKLCDHGGNKIRSTFSGIKYDFTFYQCKKCEVCVTKKECISEHVCVRDNSKYKCSKCGLYFLKLDSKSHYEVHEMNLDVDELNVNVITFDGSSAIPKERSERKLEKNVELVKHTEQTNTNISPEKQELVYKCNNCGLHYLDEQNAQRHANICNVRMKISKQNCVKCNLLFSPGELFNHLLQHHSDKTVLFKYDIVLVSKKEKRSVIL